MKKPQSIWTNIKQLIQYGTDAVGTTAKAINEVASTAEVLANTGRVMAENNREIVVIESNANKEAKLQELSELLSLSNNDKEVPAH